MSVLGMPDLGLTTVDDMVRNAGMIASLDRNVPVIADADTGYGGPLMVARTVGALFFSSAFPLSSFVTPTSRDQEDKKTKREEKHPSPRQYPPLAESSRN